MFSGICSIYLIFCDRKKYLKLKKNFQFEISRIKISKIGNCFANGSTTFFANKYGAGFMLQARFGAEFLLLGYFMARNQRIFAVICSFFFSFLTS